MLVNKGRKARKMKGNNMSNKYNGTCHACKASVPAGTGHVEVSGYGRYRKTLVWCKACFDKSDNSSDEDRCCGNRAYEDRCAEACGFGPQY